MPGWKAVFQVSYSCFLSYFSHLWSYSFVQKDLEFFSKIIAPYETVNVNVASTIFSPILSLVNCSDIYIFILSMFLIHFLDNIWCFLFTFILYLHMNLHLTCLPSFHLHFLVSSSFLSSSVSFSLSSLSSLFLFFLLNFLQLFAHQ